MRSGSWGLRSGSGSIRTVSRVHIDRLIGSYGERMPLFDVLNLDAARLIDRADDVEDDTDRLLCLFLGAH